MGATCGCAADSTDKVSELKLREEDVKVVIDENTMVSILCLTESDMVIETTDGKYTSDCASASQFQRV